MTEKRENFMKELKVEPKKTSSAALAEAKRKYEKAIEENEESKKYAKEPKEGEASEIVAAMMYSSSTTRRNLADAENEYKKALADYEQEK